MLFILILNCDGADFRHDYYLARFYFCDPHDEQLQVTSIILQDSSDRDQGTGVIE